MRDYQIKKNNPYVLPKTLYKRVIAVIRDYDRVREEIEEVLNGTPDHDSISGGMPGKPTESAALRLLQYEEDAEAVKKAVLKIPEEYRIEVFNNLRYGTKFPETASYRTWLRQRQRLVYETAKNLKLL